MAGYKEHISVSGFLGVLFGVGTVFSGGFSVVHGALAAALTWVAGMLPDLDSGSGRPIRELFSLSAALAPLLLLKRLLAWSGDVETAALLIVLLYVLVRYGGAWMVGRIAVHRGMFHSVPALLIAAELTFLAYQTDALRVRLMMATAAALGYLSHLVLDELYSVTWTGIRLKRNQAAGSALKVFGNSLPPNAVTFALLSVVTYLALIDAGVIRESPLHQLPNLIHEAFSK